VTGFHLVLGAAVVLLCLAAGVLGLLKRSGRREAAIGAWALGALIIQVATGMFLLTAAESVEVVHVLLPSAGLAVVLGARAVKSEAGATMMGAAYLFAAATAVVAFLTGVAAG